MKIGQKGIRATYYSSVFSDSLLLSNNLTDSETATHNGSVTVNYTVQTPRDTQAPTAPASLTATVQRKNITVSWQASTDINVVAGYQVFRDGIKVATTTTTDYSDSNLTSGTTYTYYVTAFDPDNNVSSPSNSANVTYGNTPGGGGKKH
jgi:hypothetical protein